ncbi:ester cyclase [Marivita sp. GX14005]|uniref:ester cyclase n=1 Tax=Marivita sp. GX14005 TaxID=2942276 RepID=UPI002018A2AB|nr:ester cyclase [Marivita sp. GX14005]MCL3880861.1 ester cyclase [Marivita sp. GX14005]
MRAAAETRAVMAPWFEALSDMSNVAELPEGVFAPDAILRLGYPFEAARGIGAFWLAAYDPLKAALSGLERQETIRIAGLDGDGALWVGSCGQYLGHWSAHWLGIPPSHGTASMRFHEFYRVENGVCVEMQALWDIPEMMMQAGVWPMVPQLGRFHHAPSPMTQDGLGPHDAGMSEGSCAHVVAMLAAMGRHPLQGGPEVMEMERFWHPRFMWYGPAGIGTARGVEEFRRFHQIPFLAAMPDRGQHATRTRHHFIAEGAYVGVTGWPNMCQTLSGGGWLGLPALGHLVTLRSLDFWRIENGLIRENWVLVDLLDLYDQIGIDVFARMKELAWSRGRA